MTFSVIPFEKQMFIYCEEINDVPLIHLEEWEIILYNFMYIVILFLLQRKFYALYIDLCQIKAFINSNYWTKKAAATVGSRATLRKGWIPSSILFVLTLLLYTVWLYVNK